MHFLSRSRTIFAVMVRASDGPKVTADLVERLIDEELGKIREQYGDAFDGKRFAEAVSLFKEVALADEYADFLTLPAYERMP